MTAAADVVVVGAGPTGLTLAAQLRRFGVTVRVIDRQLDRAHESRALVMQPRTLELLRGLGIAQTLIERGNDAIQLRMHFGNRVVAMRLFDIGLEDSAYPFLLFISQAETEAVLSEHLACVGVQVERGVELLALTAGAKEVTCTLRHQGGRVEQVRPRYLIGCVPAYAIVASVGVVALTRRWTILVPVIVALVAVSAATATSITRDPGNEDYRAAARFIDEAARGGDAIGFSPAWARTGVLVYLRKLRGDASERLPVDVALAPNGSADQVGDIFAREVEPAELVRRLHAYPRLWVVGYRVSGWHPTPEPMKQVERGFVERRYKRLLQRTFGILQVKLYEWRNAAT